MAPSKLGISNTFQAAREAFEQNRPLVIRLSLALAVLSATSSLLNVAGAAGLAISFGFTILLGAAYGGMITAMVCLPGKAENMGELWPTVQPILARLIWITLITALAIIAGMFAFIFPGLIILTVWSVAGQAAVVERTSVFDSLRRSFALIRDIAWQVFGYILLVLLLVLVFAAIALLIGLPFGTGVAGNAVNAFLTNLLTTPVIAISFAALYNRLVEMEKADQPEETDPFAP